MMNKVVIFILLTLLSESVFGQIPSTSTPQPANMPSIPSYIPNTNNTSSSTIFPDVNRNQQLDMYEQDRLYIERRDAALRHQFLQNSKQSISYDLPSNLQKRGADSYLQAAKTLNDMLNGKRPLSLKDAVYAVENAYFDGKLEYNKYSKAIQDMITTAKLATKQEGYNWNNPTTRNIMLFRVMSDTLKIKVQGKEKRVVSYPLSYDYDDYNGKKSYTSFFVSKLLRTKRGQCHSMPLLYLILCEATNTEANWAFSPKHTYVKFKDAQGSWYNLELTCGYIVSDAFIMGSNFITAEALKNKIYMEPQTKKQALAECLGDLAIQYMNQFGCDRFIESCADTLVKYSPHSLRGMGLKGEYQTEQLKYVTRQVGSPPPDTLKTHYPRMYNLYKEWNKTMTWMKQSGYREMPDEAYQKWLNFIHREKEKQEHNDKMKFLIQSN